MSSFPAQAVRVRDTGVPLRRRLLALRECILHFAPYGFRATWHHLVVNAGIPVRLEEDPSSLLRALVELEDARRLWLIETRSYAALRQQEKTTGIRVASRADSWRSWANWLAFCPDPEAHPAEPLAIVVARLLATYRTSGGSTNACPACTEPRPSPTGPSRRPCPRCGVCSWDPSAYPWNAAGVRPPAPASTSLPWPLIWHRAVRRAGTVGGGSIDQFRAEYTPTSPDRLFGVFQLYVRGVALGDATTTALLPHVQDLQSLAQEARRPGSRGADPLDLGDTFDHLDLAVETTGPDMIFTLVTRPRSEWAVPPPWAPAPSTTMRLQVPRAEVTRAWDDAEPYFRQFLGRR